MHSLKQVYSELNSGKGAAGKTAHIVRTRKVVFGYTASGLDYSFSNQFGGGIMIPMIFCMVFMMESCSKSSAWGNAISRRKVLHGIKQ